MTRRDGKLGAMALAFLGLLWAASGVALAEDELNVKCTGSGNPYACCTGSGSGTCTAAFRDGYYGQYDNVGSGAADDTLRITNTNGVPAAFTAPPAPLCAMIYVFDTRQELQECCGCEITHAGRIDLSVNHNLTQASLTGQTLHLGAIKVVSTNANTGTAPGTVACDPTDGGGTGSPFSFTPAASMRAWITHAGNAFNPAAVTEEELEYTGEPDVDFLTLANLCGDVQFIGKSNRRGVCICPPAS